MANDRIRVPDSPNPSMHRSGSASLRIERVGLVTSVGSSAAASCAAFRAKVTNPSETHFLDLDGERIFAHQVALAEPWRGLKKLARMATIAIEDAFGDLPAEKRRSVPVLLCVAEPGRPGRTEGVDGELLSLIQNELSCDFAPRSAVVPQGRVGVATALRLARDLIAEAGIARVMVAASDGFLSRRTLEHYLRHNRLLVANNSNGFMPGEGAGALLLGAGDASSDGLFCRGIGFGGEPAYLGSGEPLRAHGLTDAIRNALGEAGHSMREMDFRITDICGEQYYFKEATLALSRTLRQRTQAFDIWHPAECTGELGAVAGISMIAAVKAACEKRYSLGNQILAHLSNDAGERAAFCLEYRVAE